MVICPGGSPVLDFHWMPTVGINGELICVMRSKWDERAATNYDLAIYYCTHPE